MWANRGASAPSGPGSLGRHSVAFDYDLARTSVAALYEALKAAGHRAGSAAMHVKIKGMTCASCITAIEEALRATPGVLSAHANLGTEEAVVQYVPGTTDVEAVRKAVASAGYEIADTPPPMRTTAVAPAPGVHDPG